LGGVQAAHVYGQALDKVLLMREAGEPQTVSWLASNLALLEERLLRQGVASPSSVRSYISRTRRALNTFLANAPKASERAVVRPIVVRTHADSVVTASVSLSFQQQMSEALASIARWPKLQPFLLPALLDAMRAENEEGGK
jgi:hypothetical protein